MLAIRKYFIILKRTNLLTSSLDHDQKKIFKLFLFDSCKVIMFIVYFTDSFYKYCFFCANYINVF